MARLLWLLAASMLVSGCIQGPAESGDQKMACLEGDDCAFEDQMTVRIAFDGAGPRVLRVPLPTGDWCLQPSQWTLGPGTALGSINQTERGAMLQVAAGGDFRFEAHVKTQGLATCQTFRYDPWTIDPDPADGTVDVHSDAPGRVTFDVEDRRGGCWTTTTYEGAVSAGWTTLQMAADASTVCV
jgi:hypothetical protein